MKKIALLLSIVLNSICFAQDKIEYVDFETISNETSSYSDKKEYDKIIGVLNKVNKNDSIYTSILITKSYYFMQLKNYKEAIEVTKEGLKRSDDNDRLSFYINQSLSYWYLKDSENAMKTIDRALKEFPKNYSLYYRKGWFYHKMKKYTDALEMYKHSLILNPFNPDVHLKIGNICYKQHLITQAMMCFNTYLLLNPEGEAAFEVLNSLDKILAQKNENENVEGLKVSKDDDAFEEIDLILDNRIALSADYKIDNEINISFVKQNHALFQKLNDFNGNGGFWDTKYVQLHKWIAANKYFDDFVYTTTYSIKNPKFKKIVEKKTDAVIAFIKLFKNKWAEILEENEMMFNGKKQLVSSHFNNYKLEGIGTKKNDTLVGYWEFFDAKGEKLSKGSFDVEGKRTGKWIWYYKNDTINEIAFYQKGNLEGENIAYYTNGKVKYKTNYSNNLLNGHYSYFNENGALLHYKDYKDGELDGKYHSFYLVGESVKNQIVSYVNGKAEGNVIQYFPNGKKLFEATYKNNEKQGKEKEYYSSGSLMSEYDLLDGKFSGSYKNYFKNGVLFKEGNYLDNRNIGLWKTYYPKGNLKEKFNYTKGEIDGPYLAYAPNGKLHSDFTYRNDELIAYKYYDQEGKVLKDTRKKGGEFFYEGSAINGNKVAEGLYDVEGGKTGEWKFYTDNGILSSKGTYKKNLAQGEYISYHNNGNVKSITNYLNDTITGYSVNYFANKKMEVQGWYLKGNAHKEWHYYYQDGTLKSINYYHKGNFHSEQQYFSVEGKLSQVHMYKYGDLISEKNYDYKGELLKEISYTNLDEDFVSKTHHPNKKKFTETTYKFGVRHGPYKAFDFYGNTVLDGNYFNGEASGKWTWYSKNNKPLKEATFLNGEYHGIVNYYYDHGNLENTYEYNLNNLMNTAYSYADDGKTIIGSTEYLNDNKHGRRIFYSDEGKLQLVRFYEYDRLLGYSYLDKEGNEIPMIEIKNETAKIISFFDNGNKAREMEVINGRTENEYKSYYYNGNLHRSHFNKNDDYDGEYRVYYPNGKVKEERIYKDGEMNGLTKKYYDNGQLKEVVNYLNNAKSGEAKYYTLKGNLKKIEKYFNDNIYDAEQF